MREIGLLKGIAFLLELRDRRGHIHGIPHNDGVRNQIETTSLMSQHLPTGMTQVALIGVPEVMEQKTTILRI